MKWWKHAFAVDPPGPAEPTEEQKIFTDWLCGLAVRRRMTTPSLMALTLSRPLNYIISQAMVCTTPMVELFTDNKGYHNFAEFLEHRGSIEYLCHRIEELEAEASHRNPEEEEKNRQSQDNTESSFNTEEFQD